MSGSRIGITGHSRLTDRTHELVAAALAVCSRTCGPWSVSRAWPREVTSSSLTWCWSWVASLEVILPSNDYREAKVDPADRFDFDRLLGRASVVRVLDVPRADRAAYRAANEAMIAARSTGSSPSGTGLADEQPGTTADTVLLAERSGVPVTPVWPDGAERA